MPTIPLTRAEKEEFLTYMSQAFATRAREDKAFRDSFYKPQWEQVAQSLLAKQEGRSTTPLDDKTMAQYMNAGFQQLMDMQDEYDSAPDEGVTEGLEVGNLAASHIASYITSPPMRSRLRRIGQMRKITGDETAGIAVPEGQEEKAGFRRAVDTALHLLPGTGPHEPMPAGGMVGPETRGRFNQQLVSASRRVLSPEATEQQRQAAVRIGQIAQSTPNETPLSDAEKLQYYASRAAQGLHGLGKLGVGGLAAQFPEFTGVPAKMREAVQYLDPSQGDVNAGGVAGYLRQGAQMGPRTTPEEAMFAEIPENAAALPAYGGLGKMLAPASEATGTLLARAPEVAPSLLRGLGAVGGVAERVPVLGNLVRAEPLAQSLVRHGPALLNAAETGVAFRGLHALSEYGLYGAQAGVQALLDPEGWAMDLGFPLALRYGPFPGRTRIRTPRAKAPVGARRVPKSGAEARAAQEQRIVQEGYAQPQERHGLTPGEQAVVESEVMPVSPAERRPPMREATVPQPDVLKTAKYPGRKVMVPEQQYNAKELLDYAKSGQRAGKGTVDLDDPRVRQRLIYDGQRADATTPAGMQARLDMRDALDYELYLNGQKSMLGYFEKTVETTGQPTDQFLKDLRPEAVDELRAMAQGPLVDESGAPVRQTHWALSLLSKMERLAATERAAGEKKGVGKAATAAAPAQAEFADKTLQELEKLIASRDKSIRGTATRALGRPPRDGNELREALTQAGWGTQAVEDNIAYMARLRQEIDRRRSGTPTTTPAGERLAPVEKPAEPPTEEFPEFREPGGEEPPEEPPTGAAPSEPPPTPPTPAPPTAGAAPGGVERRSETVQQRMERLRNDEARIDADTTLSMAEKGEKKRALQVALQQEIRRQTDAVTGPLPSRAEQQIVGEEPMPPTETAPTPTPAPKPTAPAKPGLRIAESTAQWARLTRANRDAIVSMERVKNNEQILDPRTGETWTKQKRGLYEGKRAKDGTLVNDRTGEVIPVRSERAVDIAIAHASLLAQTEAPTTRRARRSAQARNIMLARRLANPRRSSMQEFRDTLLDPDVVHNENLLHTILAQLQDYLNPVLQRVGMRSGIKDVRIPTVEGERVVGRPVERTAEPQLQDLAEDRFKPIMRRDLERVESGELRDVETSVPMSELGPSAQARRVQASYRLSTIPYDTLLRATEHEGDVRAQRNAGGLNPEDRYTQSEREQLRTIRAVLGEGNEASTARVEARLQRLPTDIRERAAAAIEQRKQQAMQVGEARTNVPMQAYSATDLRSKFTGRTRFHTEEEIQDLQDRMEMVRIAQREQQWSTDRGTRVFLNIPIMNGQYAVERILPALPGATLHLTDGRKVKVPAETDITRDRVYQAETDSLVLGGEKIYAGDIAGIEQQRPRDLSPKQLESLLNAVYDTRQERPDLVQRAGEERTFKPPVKHMLLVQDYLARLRNDQLGALSAYMNFDDVAGAKLPPNDLRKEHSRLWGGRQRNSYFGSFGLQDLIYNTLVARARGVPAATREGTIPEFVRKEELGRRRRIRMEEEVERRPGEMMATAPRQEQVPKPEGPGAVLATLESAYKLLRGGFERGNPLKVRKIREMGAVEPDITWTDTGLAAVQNVVDSIGRLHAEDLKDLQSGRALDAILWKRLMEDPGMQTSARDAEGRRVEVNKLADPTYSESQAMSLLSQIIGAVKQYRQNGKWEFERIGTEYGTERGKLSEQERAEAAALEGTVDSEASLSGQDETSLTETGEGEPTPYERAQAQRGFAFSGQMTRRQLMNIVETALENKDKLEQEGGAIADDQVAEALDLLNDPTEFDTARAREAHFIGTTLSGRLKRMNVNMTGLNEKYNPRTRKQGYVNLEQFLTTRPEVSEEQRAGIAQRYVAKRETARQRALPQAAPRQVIMRYRKRGRMQTRRFMTRGAAGELISRIGRELDILMAEKPTTAQVKRAEDLGTLAEQVHDYELSRQRYAADTVALERGKPKQKLQILGAEKMTPQEQAAELALEEGRLNRRLVQLGTSAQALGVKLPVALQIRLEVASAAPTAARLEQLREAAAAVPEVAQVLKESPPAQLTRTTPAGTQHFLVPYDRLELNVELPTGRARLVAKDKETGKQYTTSRSVQEVLSLLRSGKYDVVSLSMHPNDVVVPAVVEHGQKARLAIENLVDFDAWGKYRVAMRSPVVDEVMAATEEEPDDGGAE